MLLQEMFALKIWLGIIFLLGSQDTVFGISLKDTSEDVSIISGETATLTCSFNSAEDVNFEWRYKERSISFSDTVYPVPITAKINQLVIKNVKTSQEGNYTCVGSNSEGTAQGVVQLRIITIEPEILPIPDQYLAEEMKYTIVCSAPDAYPKVTYIWSKKNAFFDPDHVTDHKNGSLTIKKMRMADEGVYVCKATNNGSTDTKEFRLNLVKNNSWWLQQPINTNRSAGDSLTLEVSLASATTVVKMVWLKDRNVVPTERYAMDVAGAKYTTKMMFDEVQIDDAGEYAVTVEYAMISGPTKYATLIVLSKPIVDIGEGDEIRIKEGSDVMFICMVQAYPTLTQVQWLRNGTVIPDNVVNQTKTVTGLKTTLILQLKSVSLESAGNYQCFAENNQGKGLDTIKLLVEAAGGSDDKDDNKTVIIVVVVVSVLIILFIIVFVFLYIKFKDAWCGNYKDANGTFYTDLVQEEKDASCVADIEKNPYSIKKNINISIKQAERSGSLGGRLFSDASRAPTAKNRSFGRSLKMSLKAPNATVSENHYAPLDSLTSQGKAIEFKHIVFDEILGVGEYGQVNGGRVINEENTTVYKDVSIKMLKDEASAQARRDILAELRMMRRISKHPNVIGFIGWCITDDNVYVLEEYAPFGSLLTFLRTQRLVSQSTESLNELPIEDGVDTKTLLSFSWQIASGMEHLANLQIVHRDLACRNVYLGHEKTCKISEYGLVRDIYAENVYRKTTGGQLPVRWMAREAVFDGQYTTESDVWSFGILIWELITLGKIPYPGIVRTEQLLDELESGYHMENPGHISTDLYLLMNSCWDYAPASRPTFTKLRSKLATFMNDEEEEHINLEKLFQQEYMDSDDSIRSPTEDFHRPSDFKSIEEEQEQNRDPQLISSVDA